MYVPEDATIHRTTTADEMVEMLPVLIIMFIVGIASAAMVAVRRIPLSHLPVSQSLPHFSPYSRRARANPLMVERTMKRYSDFISRAGSSTWIQYRMSAVFSIKMGLLSVRKQAGI